VREPPGRITGEDALDAVAGLIDPARRRLYRYVVEQVEPVGRDDAAAATAMTRSLAGYHLDRLVEDELLEVTYARRSGRRGPGAGRPAKLYQPAAVEVTVQLPARDDALVAHLLATAIEADASGEARRTLRRVTRAAGRALGDTVTREGHQSLIDALVARGYDPVVVDDGVRLRNCPFHHLVDGHLELVCHLNHDLLTSAAARAGSDYVAELDPQPGQCCVRLRPRVKGSEG
jgi:predicted ArsR family transcriptional regulator